MTACLSATGYVGLNHGSLPYQFRASSRSEASISPEKVVVVSPTNWLCGAVAVTSVRDLRVWITAVLAGPAVTRRDRISTLASPGRQIA
jgi:hypothetical protein